MYERESQYNHGLLSEQEFEQARDNFYGSITEILERGRANLGRDYPNVRRELSKLEPKTPVFPNWEKYYETPIKDALARAVESGADGFTWSTPESRVSQWTASASKMYQTLYADKITSLIKKETGIEPKIVPIKKEVPGGIYSPFTGSLVPAGRLEVVGQERFIPVTGNRVRVYRQMQEEAGPAYRLRARVDRDDIIPSLIP